MKDFQEYIYYSLHTNLYMCFHLHPQIFVLLSSLLYSTPIFFASMLSSNSNILPTQNKIELVETSINSLYHLRSISTMILEYHSQIGHTHILYYAINSTNPYYTYILSTLILCNHITQTLQQHQSLTLRDSLFPHCRMLLTYTSFFITIYFYNIYICHILLKIYILKFQSLTYI